MAARTATSWDGTAGPRRSARATRPAGRAQPAGGGGGPPSPSLASAEPAGARGHPSPGGSRAGGGLSGGRRAASPCTAPERAANRCCSAGAPRPGPARAARLEPEWARTAGRAASAEPAGPAERAPPRPGPAPAPAPAPAARPGTPPRASGRGRRLSAARRPRPQPPAPPPAARVGVRASPRAVRRPKPAGRSGGRRAQGGGRRGPGQSRGLAVGPPSPRRLSPGSGRVGRPGVLGGEEAVSSYSELYHPLPATMQAPASLSVRGDVGSRRLPGGRVWGRETSGRSVPSAASACGRFKTLGAEPFRCLGEVSNQTKEEIERGEAESC